jgi:DNA-binding IclR family transcriptional regulator
LSKIGALSHRRCNERNYWFVAMRLSCRDILSILWRASMGLTSSHHQFIIADMTEPSVRHIEQRKTRQADDAITGASTPMVERTFRLLDLLSASEDGLTFSDLVRALGISKGSLHGLLKSLERARAVEQVDGRRYVVGPRIYDLALAYSQRAGLRRVALPGMRRLADEIGETIFLGRVEGDRVRVVDRCNAESDPSALHISAAPGAHVPLLAAAVGRVVLASWSPARREEYLRTHPLPRYTEHTVTDLDQFLAAVAATAQSGVGMDHQEYLAGVNAVAVPIRGLGGALAGLLWVVGFATRLDGDAMLRAGELLRDEAEAIAQAMDAAR